MARLRAMNTFLTNLDRIRKERGLTQSELADLLGTTQSGVSRLLNGGEDVTLSRCEKIARTLGVTLVELLEEHELAKS